MVRLSDPNPSSTATHTRAVRAGHCINHILYQRGIYPAETFERVQNYGMTMFKTTDAGLNAYLENVLRQLTSWLSNSAVQKLVVVISSQETSEPLERWVFDVHADKSIGPEDRAAKSQKEVKAEIAALCRQISASVSFLPLIDEPCAFDLLVYTDDDVQEPSGWEESDPRYIVNADEVKLHSTAWHSIRPHSGSSPLREVLCSAMRCDAIHAMRPCHAMLC